MTREVQIGWDIILIPSCWCPVVNNTLESQEPDWWYTISDVIRFGEYRSCKKRIDEDQDRGPRHQTQQDDKVVLKEQKKKETTRSKKEHGEDQKGGVWSRGKSDHLDLDPQERSDKIPLTQRKGTQKRRTHQTVWNNIKWLPMYLNRSTESNW